jgi:hypothetical protein
MTKAGEGFTTTSPPDWSTNIRIARENRSGSENSTMDHEDNTPGEPEWTDMEAERLVQEGQQRDHKREIAKQMREINALERVDRALDTDLDILAQS